MFKKLLHKYQNTTDLNRFLIKGATLFLAWRVFRKWMVLKGQFTDFTQSVSAGYLWLSRQFLNVFGLDNHVDYASRKLWLEGASDAVYVAYDCLGVNLFFIYLIFLLAYPGRIKTKLWMIPVGFAVIFTMNAMRMAALTKILVCCPSRMELFHHFIFQGIIYIAIFIMWWWFTRIGNRKGSIN